MKLDEIMYCPICGSRIILDSVTKLINAEFIYNMHTTDKVGIKHADGCITKETQFICTKCKESCYIRAYGTNQLKTL